jgi:hypothetical protein
MFGPSLSSPRNVVFNNPAPDPANGTFVVTGSGSVSSDLDQDANRNYRDSLVVNPKFRVEYRTPNVAYDSTFALYNSTGR